MYTQKLVSIVLITMLSITNIYSESVICINCIANIKDNQNDNSPKFKPFEIAYNTKNPNDPNYIIPLDNNGINSEANNTTNIDTISSDIVLIDKTIEENNSLISSEDTTLYACEDTEKQTLVCDNINKVCQCV